MLYYIKSFMKSLQEECLHLSVLHSVLGVETVDVHPLHNMEWRENLAVVEASGGLNTVVDWSSHHGGLSGLLSLVAVLSVVHVSPDPQWSFVVWSLVVTKDELLSLLLVSGQRFLSSVLNSPVNGLLVDLLASLSDLIGFVEVSVGVSSLDLHVLSTQELGSHLSGGNWVEPTVEGIEGVVQVLSDSDGLEGAA